MSALGEAVAALQRGRVAVIPTDTVYGVAAAPTDAGVAALFRVKQRPRDKAIPVLAGGVDDLAGVAELPPAARRLAARFWPGALTLVVPRASGFRVDLGGADTSTVGVRVPDHPLALELLGRTGPLAVTSANRSGRAPAADVAGARAALGSAVSVYLDGGPAGGEASTVVALTPRLRVLRVGAVAPEQLWGAVG